MLDDAQIHQFINDGYVKIVEAFRRGLADRCRAILWPETGCNENDPSTWTKPVIRLGAYGQEPFFQAANTTELHEAFDQLVGEGRWLPRADLGTFPIRFPSADDPGDAGWHVDTSFPPEGLATNDFLSWHVNVSSKGRALLMLFLFSDVSESDAPTRIRVGSHFDVARMLAPAGERGLSLRKLAASAFPKPQHDRRSWRPAMQARFTSVIRSWYTPLSHIAAPGLASWLNRRFCLPSLFVLIARTVRILLSRKPSASLSKRLKSDRLVTPRIVARVYEGSVADGKAAELHHDDCQDHGVFHAA